jgi:hypothetical protein
MHENTNVAFRSIVSDTSNLEVSVNPQSNSWLHRYPFLIPLLIQVFLDDIDVLRRLISPCKEIGASMKQYTIKRSVMQCNIAKMLNRESKWLIKLQHISNITSLPIGYDDVSLRKIGFGDALSSVLLFCQAPCPTPSLNCRLVTLSISLCQQVSFQHQLLISHSARSSIDRFSQVIFLYLSHISHSVCRATLISLSLLIVFLLMSHISSLVFASISLFCLESCLHQSHI